MSAQSLKAATGSMTPLQSLVEANKAFRKRGRPRKTKAVQINQKIERQYSNELTDIVRLMASTVRDEVFPLLETGITDSYTKDASISSISEVIRNMASRFIGGLFGRQVERLSRRSISRAEASSTDEFIQSANNAVGVDVSSIIRSDNLQSYLDASVRENVGLIESLSHDYFSDIEQIVLNAYRDGQSRSSMVEALIDRTGISERRAKLIARDQMAKVNSDVQKHRASQLGIKRFRWLTAADQRVSGNPAGKYPNAKIKCYQIARQDNGMGAGVYNLSEGASYGGESGLMPGRAHVNCRCSYRMLIPGIDYDDTDE